ncbi:hypothetical protein [Brucella rhizosphaerae]|uniref:hypothetical protein n=1 Tax=Brucella rhizosphaerae TaxID=571254 RepID=UPI000467C207|nr:hypothetical protein [Brucella rhizosphaerae]
MLSDCLREMRSELEKASFRSGPVVELAAVDVQSYILALKTYERLVRQMEKQLAAPKPAPVSTLCEIVTFPTKVSHSPQHTVINDDGGSVA